MGRPGVGVSDRSLLRVSPPRMPRALVERSRLLPQKPEWDAPAVLVQAPAGCGKTFLMAQWRKACLAEGAVAAWVSVQPGDDSGQFLQALVTSMRLAAARPTFCHALLLSMPASPIDAMTAWLAEVSQYALSTVLFIDDADRLSESARQALTYLLHNATPNLRLVVAARAEFDLNVQDLLSYGECVAVSGSALRFQLGETLQLVAERLGDRVDRDTVARLHEVTEGWPLGLQLVLTVAAGAADPRSEILALCSGGGLRDDLMEHMLRLLDAEDVGLLTRVSILEHLYPDLCEAVSGMPDTLARLERMSRDTPVLSQAEQGTGYRLHNLARLTLQRKFAALPGPERAELHERAARWLSSMGELEAAARHALEAGRSDFAYDLAERSLYDSLMAEGHQPEVMAWIDRLPADVLEARPRLLLPAAWSLALSERNDEAARLVERLLAAPGVSDELRCECDLILSGAAIFADDPDRFASLHDPWADNPPLAAPALLHVHANRTAYRTLIDGNPSLARLKQQQAPHLHGNAQGYLNQWGELVIGLTYLWEGQVLLAEKLLRPTLARAEIDLGRRNPFVCMLASFLAAAVWEQDRPDDAVTLLADRLDVLERRGLPEAVLLAFRTLARAAIQNGQEHRAMELLDAMHALGVARRMPRLCVASLTDQIRMHARRYRAETAKRLLDDIDVILAQEIPGRGPLWVRSVQAMRDLAAGYALVAARRWREAVEPLARAYHQASQARMGRLSIEILGLRAFVLDQAGERSQDLLREALDLAAAYGLMRVFSDVHPDLGAWIDRVRTTSATVPAPVRPVIPGAATTVHRMEPRPTASLILTPKEREVVELLSRNLSNKEIGLAMDVGEETIKWHMKNLFAKLDAGNRKQVVARARLLGLIGG